MKKVFISCPMRGRSRENIEKSISKMKAAAELMIGEELELLPSYQPDDVLGTNRKSIEALGKSIQVMADADLFVHLNVWGFMGTTIENKVAESYDIPIICLEEQYFAPDLRTAWEQIKATKRNMEDDRR